MGIIAWIIFGLIAGIIAKLIMPGRDGGGFPDLYSRDSRCGGRRLAGDHVWH
jgi:hypothetical protein